MVSNGMAGMERKLDDLGRIPLPEEYCRTLRIRTGDAVKLTAENGCIFLEKTDLDKPREGGYVIRRMGELFRIVLLKTTREMLHMEDGAGLFVRLEESRIAISKMPVRPVCRICGKGII